MRATLILLLSLCLFSASAATGKVAKVLPLLLDQKGHVANSPSLFDRDAYQLHLHQHTNEISGVRYDVQWSAKDAAGEKLKVRLELRGVTTANLPKLKTLENEVTPATFGNWTSFTLTGDDYTAFGGITAWRATLWSGDAQIGEQKSFLW
jgi:hypothetical protein